MQNESLSTTLDFKNLISETLGAEYAVYNWLVLWGCSIGGFRHVQHIRPNRGPHKKGAPQKDKLKKILQHGNKPEILK